ncbi:hypothetical protein [Chryseosolibacter indicus]|uniref:Lipoprotein n=1 Tax=Chryseosolibacter indicus TaxID=2782351 RepID=A0ABS5VV56_9BACT|nr:hypothetical protein [Chryseosolibacter indicus]MBT1705309.1 hypothetical protein [Chryseosolibacter indicus]
MKRNLRIYGAVSAVLLASCVMSCEDQLLDEPQASNQATPSTGKSKTSARFNEQPSTDIKSVKLEKDDLVQIQELLKEVDPELYQIEVHEGGKVVDRIGSAAIYDLQKVGAYYDETFGGSVAANEILTTVSDYIKTIWTAKLLESRKYAELITKVESILNRNVIRNVSLEAVKLDSKEIRGIEKALSNIDPSLFQAEIHLGGKVVSRLGSGEISDLQKVGAYYSPEFSDSFCGNEIITTVSDYIKTIWTAKLLESGRYEEEVAYVESVLSAASVR